jgi:hypothetical protein
MWELEQPQQGMPLEEEAWPEGKGHQEELESKRTW